ncbi:hypothetical protein RZN22_10435, partial [Bacillaceae bacterium S4-13-58]
AQVPFETRKALVYCEVALCNFPLCDYLGQKLRRLLEEAFSLELDKFYTLLSSDWFNKQSVVDEKIPTDCYHPRV